jgi:MarR family 2-MHQ and catechol resistance regulon transcriptional repressor
MQIGCMSQLISHDMRSRQGATRAIVEPAPELGSPDLVADAVAVQRALLELIRVVQFRDRDRLCMYDVSVSQCYALNAIADRGALTVNELSAELYLDKSTASRLANSLEEKGYVQKEPDPTDRRVVRMTMSAAGEALAKRIHDALVREHVVLLADFDPEVRRSMVHLVSRLARAFAARVDCSGGSCCSIG